MQARCVLLLVVVISIGISSVAADVGCLDESGNHVDWWVILKAPKLEKHSDRSAASGMGYSYGDSKNGAMRWTGNRLDTDKNKALGSTLNQVYSQSSREAYLIYNDQPIYFDDPSSTYAHAKGVVSWDKNGGFWLVHSVPNFPAPAGRAYDMPDSAYTNGQSFLCISLTPSGLDQVGAALLIDRPYVYSKNIPKSLSSVSANLQSVFNGDYVKDPTAQSFSIKSAGGDPFVIFAKNRQWASDLYSKHVVSILKTSIYTETWMNGPAANKLPTLCSGSNPYAVINVKEVSLSSDIKWGNSEDHSKWAISADSKKPIFCVGDINRQKSQANRGGGTLCGTDSKVWNSFKSFITDSDTCKGYNS